MGECPDTGFVNQIYDDNKKQFARLVDFHVLQIKATLLFLSQSHYNVEIMYFYGEYYFFLMDHSVAQLLDTGR